MSISQLELLIQVLTGAHMETINNEWPKDANFTGRSIWVGWNETKPV